MNTKQGRAINQCSLISSAGFFIRSHGMVRLSRQRESYLINLRLHKLQMFQSASALPEVLRRRKVGPRSMEAWSCSAAHEIELHSVTKKCKQHTESPELKVE